MPQPPSPSHKNTPTNRRCVWGNYVVGIFVIIIVVVLYFEYRDETKSVQEAVAGLPTTNNEVKATQSAPTKLQTWDGLPIGKVDCDSLTAAKAEIVLMKERIWQDWNVSSYPLFLSMMHIPKTSWDIQKAKFMRIILGEGSHGLAGKKSYVVGFSGSSVTAGHDSYFEEAFPQVFYLNLAPVLSKLHVNLTVRNHALGNNPCYAYDACIETHMGDDLDLLTWEQSMNCGRDARPVETFSRSALEMKTKPSVLFLLSGTPAWTPSDCSKVNITEDKYPRTTQLSPAERDVLKTSLKQLVTHQKFLEEMDFLKDSQDRLYDRYKATAPMGQNLFALDQYRCFGPYDRTFSLKTPGGGAPWHPGKNGHKVRGDNLAYTLVSILEEAIDNISAFTCSAHPTIQSTTITSNNSSHISKSTKRRLQSQNPKLRTLSNYESKGTSLVKDIVQKLDLSSSLSVESSFLHDTIKFADDHLHNKLQQTSEGTEIMSEETFKTNLVASVSNSLLLEKVIQPVMPSVPAHHSVPETNNRPQCFTNYEPRMKNTLETLTVTPYVNWTKELSFFDVNGVHKSEQRHLGYLDRKIIYISHSPGSFISFQIPVKHLSPVWLCECQKGFLKYPSNMADLIDGADFYLQENVNSPTITTFDIKHARKLAVQLLKDQCYRTVEMVSPGNHLLTIVQKGDRQINLSYIITW